MNDFLDRMTAKAIGNETMLAPRLPSLFEPQAASIMPATFETSAIEEPRSTHAASGLADAARRDPAREPEPLPSERRPDGATLKLAQSDTTQRPASRIASQPAIETTRPLSHVAIKEIAQPTTTDRTRRHVTPRESVEPRASRVSLESKTPSAIERPTETGELLPPARPVFASTKNLGDLPARTAEAMHSRSIGAGGNRAEQSEPVIHVSIGRLEVRAAPTSATTPSRRNDAPRPSSLDDYLRQRGKVVP